MKTKIGVIFGGRSTEHEISVISASQAMHALETDRYDIIPIYISKQGHWLTGEALRDLKNYKDLKKLPEMCTEVYMRPVYGDYRLYKARHGHFGSEVYDTLDVVIPVLHGTNVEDGIFEGVLETIGIPYAGCSTMSSANGMDKITMKMILRESGVPVVDYMWMTDKQWFNHRDELIAQIETKLGYPVIVKPANLGSSIGIGSAHDRQQLIDAVDNARTYASRIIVEHLIADLEEINCSVLGDCDDCQPSVLEEPIKHADFLTYDEKYKQGSKGMSESKKRIPAELPEDVTKEIQRLACETFRVLSCHGVSRIDFMIDRKDGRVYVNEINTIPGSLSYYLWEATGIGFGQLMDRLVALALKRQREASHKTLTYDQNIFALSPKK